MSYQAPEYRVTQEAFLNGRFHAVGARVLWLGRAHPALEPINEAARTVTKGDREWREQTRARLRGEPRRDVEIAGVLVPRSGWKDGS